MNRRNLLFIGLSWFGGLFGLGRAKAITKESVCPQRNDFCIAVSRVKHPYVIEPASCGNITFYRDDGILVGELNDDRVLIYGHDNNDLIANVKFYMPACCTLNDAGKVIFLFRSHHLKHE